MKRVAALGIDSFDGYANRRALYIDKTDFIADWWRHEDRITLITRPRRFGKTLMLDTVKTFFSTKFADKGDWFAPYKIWQDEELRALHGTYSVISVSFSDIKGRDYADMMQGFRRILGRLYRTHEDLKNIPEFMSDENRLVYQRISDNKATDEECHSALLWLSELEYDRSGKKVILLIDEYDTPMIEAYAEGFWEEAILFMRRMFHATLKDNPYLERALLTGITRITQESLFSDLNNIKVTTMTDGDYAEYFGFTQSEVDDALKEFDLYDTREDVKKWYDGYRFGNCTEIYNPWSILSYLSARKLEPYWINTSSNRLVAKIIMAGDLGIKQDFENLLKGGTIDTEISKHTVFDILGSDAKYIWSYLMTAGYLTPVKNEGSLYTLKLTNLEVRDAIGELMANWFSVPYYSYSTFVKSMLVGDLEMMQELMEGFLEHTFSFFDVGNGKRPNRAAESFYHGFTLGLLSDLRKTHLVTSNRESGRGRYDVCIEPIDPKGKYKSGVIIEFKVFDAKRGENTLEDTIKHALAQIEEKQYEAQLRAKGIETIYKYAFAFNGPECIIEMNEEPAAL